MGEDLSSKNLKGLCSPNFPAFPTSKPPRPPERLHQNQNHYQPNMEKIPELSKTEKKHTNSVQSKFPSIIADLCNEEKRNAVSHSTYDCSSVPKYS